MTDGELILVINCGSSSVKLALLDPRTGERTLTALAERVGGENLSIRLTRKTREPIEPPADRSHHGVLTHLLAGLTDEERDAVAGIGHRVVHGGNRFSASVPIDD